MPNLNETLQQIKVLSLFIPLLIPCAIIILERR